MVVLTDDDLADLTLPTAKAVELLAFVPAKQVDPLSYAGGYHLEPDEAGIKPYLLLHCRTPAASDRGEDGYHPNRVGPGP